MVVAVAVLVVVMTVLATGNGQEGVTLTETICCLV